MRALGLFWSVLLAIVVASGVGLQFAGPPSAHPVSPPGHEQRADAKSPAPALGEAIPAPNTGSRAPTPLPPSTAPGRQTAGPIPAPDPALLEPAPDLAGALLPRIASDGRMPMQVYARGFDPSSRQPRVALILAGIGLNSGDSEDAIRTLPGGVTLAVSPYAPAPGPLLDLARANEHEFLISLPMEPQGYPMNDPGGQALLTGASADQNAKRLNWVLSRIQGYVGATGALGGLRGERFAAMPNQLGPVLETLAARGLLYIAPIPSAASLPDVWNRSIDLVIDEPAVREELDAKLARLEQIARDKGSALGLAGTVRPVTVDRIAAWATGLAARGVILAPVSALVQPAAGTDADTAQANEAHR